MRLGPWALVAYARTIPAPFYRHLNVITPYAPYRYARGPLTPGAVLPDLFAKHHAISVRGTVLTVTWEHAVPTYTTESVAPVEGSTLLRRPCHPTRSTSPQWDNVEDSPPTIVFRADRTFDAYWGCEDPERPPSDLQCHLLGGYFGVSPDRSRVFIHEGWTYERGRGSCGAGEGGPQIEFARSLVGTWRLQVHGARLHLTGVDGGDSEHWLE